MLLRGDVPCQQPFSKPKNGTLLLWKVAPQDLDYSYYLPLFFDG
jgi:hypothetical protein